MNEFFEGYRLLDEMFGGGKDNLIALATVAKNPSADGQVQPIVRTVDAYYEDGTFYVSTYALSNKILQIGQNAHIAVATSPEMFTAVGIAENLGWVMEPQNSVLRDKLRKAFAWYDMANDESDKNCCILAVHLTKGTLNVNHWEKLYHMDFVNKTTLTKSDIG